MSYLSARPPASSAQVAQASDDATDAAADAAANDAADDAVAEGVPPVLCVWRLVLAICWPSGTYDGAVSSREEVDWMALLAAVRASKKGPGSGVLLQDLVVKERARMKAMVSSSQLAPR